MTTTPDTRLSDLLLHGEAAVIALLAPLAAGYPGAFGLKDDCAAFTPTPGHDLVVKTDPIAAGVHFLPDDDPADIGWKALAVNVSDLAAKAAVPRVYLMALSFPEAPTRAWMAGFAAGLGAAQQAFGMHLIGGDTDRRPGPITISITVLGEVPTGRMVHRATARPGDLVYVSGTLGDAGAGLRLLQDPAFAAAMGIDADGSAHLIARYHRPEPRLGLRAALRAHASAAMDLSDGLAKDLGRMCRASGCGAEVVRARLPLVPIVRAAVAADAARWRDVVAGGDDYEILAAIPPGAADAFADEARRGGVPVTCIGQFLAGQGIAILDDAGAPMPLASTGWDHF